ncbi:MAG TPA: hypothetical protein VFN30_01835 [Chitinophagaceae bacterium]|nr:hypothetical protein [Chitinophagaceae bacterium]
MKKIVFRFLFIYFFLNSFYLLEFYQIPWINLITEYHSKIDEWVVTGFNKYLLHVKSTLNTNGGGSGDISFAWAQFYTYILLSLLGSMLWTVLDRKRQNYDTLSFWLRNVVRYYLITFCFSYGIIKLFALQMPFPNLSLLATPLGDFLPMRLSWMFFGYSTPYQVFSGIIEIIAGLLLLNRRTIVLGSLISAGVFFNVFMLNLSYDIPVKLFSMQLFICSLFLVLSDSKRLLNFFFLNKPAELTTLYSINFNKKWQKIARILLKTGFVILFIIIPFNQTWQRYKNSLIKTEMKPIKPGIYTIKTFIKNRDTVLVSLNDSLAWKDFIFDVKGIGSINTLDTLFRQRYRRGYFIYQVDSVKEIISFKKNIPDTASIFKMKYKITDENAMELWGKVRNDSLYFKLLKSNRHFQLTEKQFHWISESNR